MSASEIKRLRTEGKLDEALALAKEALIADSENIWNKRNISWVYHGYLKKCAQDVDVEGFIENLECIKSLELPEEEQMLYNNVGFQISNILHKLYSPEQVDYQKVGQLFDSFRGLALSKPSEGYSAIMSAMVRVAAQWIHFIEFVDWWGLENLMPKDFVGEEYNKRMMQSLAEKVYSAYSRKLIEGEPLDAYGTQRRIDKEKIAAFIPKLDEVMEKHPDYRYLPYYKAQMLLELGSDEDALSAFLPFAKQKRNDFWVWEIMAKIFEDNKELHFACYCKALSLKTPDEFLLKVRQTFAGLLVERQMYNEAKTEITQILKTREEKGWKIPGQVQMMISTDWFKEATENTNNRKLYNQYKSEAEKILYKDVPEQYIAVEFVNRNKKVLNFVRGMEDSGFFGYDRLLENPEIGMVLKVQMEARGDSGRQVVHTAEAVEDFEEVIDRIPAMKIVSGSIRIPHGKDFGFVDNIFVAPPVVNSSNLVDGQAITAMVVYSFNKSKNEWSWRVAKIL